MKLGTKLVLAPLLTATIALAAGGLNAAFMHSRAGSVHAAFEADVQTLRNLSSARIDLGQIHASIYRTQAIADSLSDAEMKAFRSGLKERVDAVRAQLDKAKIEDAGFSKDIEASQALLDKYLKAADKAIELTMVDANMGVGATKAAESVYGEMLGSVQAAVAQSDKLRAERDERDAAKARFLLLLLAGLGLLSTGAAIAAAWVMQRRIVNELGEAVRVSAEVADGRLDVAIGSTRKDELGDLMRSQADMVARLSDSLQTVRQATDSISTASREIATGNLDLSQRTEQTASSLQQTASAMAQLTGTLQQTADSARSANQFAASASDVAQRGGNVVAQVVAMMDEINASSKRIADIIGTIDSIAFQTNILALNAAVEAARAGEQGRGFAVVASEVRSLAQRSAEAAREIKALIGASVDKVDSGSRLVADAGSTMTEIVASVRRVSDLVGEISTAAAEQSGGIGSMNTAVGSLDQMTQQNAALVEQSAAAAESLKEQALKLGEVVSRFRFGGERADAARPVPGAPAVHVPRATAPTPAQVTQVTLARLQARAAAPAKPATTRAALPEPARSAGGDDDWTSF